MLNELLKTVKEETDKVFKPMSAKHVKENTPSKEKMVAYIIHCDMKHSPLIVFEKLLYGFDGYDKYSDEEIRNQYFDLVEIYGAPDEH